MASPQYGRLHQLRRASLLRRFRDGDICAICGDPMYSTQLLDADHSIPVSQGGKVADRLTHRACNRRRGDGTRHPPPPPRTVTPPRNTTVDWFD